MARGQLCTTLVVHTTLLIKYSVLMFSHFFFFPLSHNVCFDNIFTFSIGLFGRILLETHTFLKTF